LAVSMPGHPRLDHDGRLSLWTVTLTEAELATVLEVLAGQQVSVEYHTPDGWSREVQGEEVERSLIEES
jgi:hypothetical protein